MWMLNNETPFAAERNWSLDKNAAKSWFVAVKATFTIAPNGTTALAEEQLPPLLAPEYRGEPGQSSVLYEADLAGPKRRTDVFLNGHAYAAPKPTATEVAVSLKVAGIAKQLVVVGNRRWEKGMLGLSLSKPEPFEKMPIVYERAFGGWDKKPEKVEDQRWEPRNPVGAGFAIRAEHLVGAPVANVEDPKQRIGSWKDRPQPAGYGAVASYWSPRQKYAGTYDENWLKNRLPLLAADFDERYYQAAPEDQQCTGFLRGGEPVELTGLTPDGRLAFTLPRVTLGFQTRFGTERIDHLGSLASIILEPDVPRVILVWQSLLPVPNRRVDYLDETIIFEKEQLTSL
jgi:hypothetical protein